MGETMVDILCLRFLALRAERYNQRSASIAHQFAGIDE
jgi:hypothetical protein